MLLCLGALASAACGREDDAGAPVACRQGSNAVRAALRSAPGKVTLDGTPLSSCLRSTSDASELRDVGTAYVQAAAQLSDVAVRRPGGPEAMQLGYLIGAVHSSSFPSEGSGSELVRRLEQEATRIDTSSPAFRRGERAGRHSG